MPKKMNSLIGDVPSIEQLIARLRAIHNAIDTEDDREEFRLDLIDWIDGQEIDMENEDEWNE